MQEHHHCAAPDFEEGHRAGKLNLKKDSDPKRVQRVGHHHHDPECAHGEKH